MTKDNMTKRFLHYIDLESDLDKYEVIHQTIEKDIIFKGTNLWILVFAVLIASVGLNMNSTAVIIGAMLISPLMGPINGMGYSIATYDFPLFRRSLKNFSFAVITGLIASTVYFALSPISTAHSELLARTSPTIYDVLIALLGGLAGIVAISSKNKGNVIPGVAIATALMPPLCTAGYGIATGQPGYFFGAFFLFTINTAFIALSSVAISQILKFPIRSEIEESQKKKINRWISAVIMIIVIPSIYFGYVLVQKERFVKNANEYIDNIGTVDGNYLLKDEINPAKKSITLIFGGPSLNEIQKNSIKDKAKLFSLENATITLQQGLSFDVITKKISEEDKMRGELNRMKVELQEKSRQLDSLQKRKWLGREILEEIKAIYPNISGCSFGEALNFSNPKADPENGELVVFTISGKQLYSSDRKKIEAWLKKRLKTDSIQVFYEK